MCAWGVRMPVVAHQRHGSVAHEMVRVADERRILQQDVFQTRGRSKLGSTQISIKNVPCGIGVFIAAHGVTGVDLDILSVCVCLWGASNATENCTRSAINNHG